MKVKHTGKEGDQIKPKFPNRATLRKLPITDLEKLSDMVMDEIERRQIPWTWARVAQLIKQNITDPDWRKKYLDLLDDPQVRRSQLLTIHEGKDILTALGLCLI